MDWPMDSSCLSGLTDLPTSRVLTGFMTTPSPQSWRAGYPPDITDLLLPEQFARCFDDVFGSKSELLHHIFHRSGSSKCAHTNHAAFEAHIPLPAQSRARFDRNARGYVGRQNAVAITLVLAFEKIPGWHADHACPNPFLFQSFIRSNAEAEFTAGTNQDDLRFAAIGIRKDVRALSNARGRSIFGTIQRRQRLPRQNHYCWFMTRLHYDFVSFGNLV